jgi:Rod binding domain-containing protein
MNAISGVATAMAEAKDDPAKLIRAAHQFEAVLLNQLFGSLEHSFSTLGKDDSADGADQYRYLGMQALATSIAGSGGIGIAGMIIRSLNQPEQHSAGSAAQ